MRKLLYIILAVLLCACKKDVTVAFTYSPENPKAGETVTFVNASTGGESWLWLFGDKSTSTYRSPSHVFTRPGQYLVTMQADGEARFMTSQTIVVGDTLPSINAPESLDYMTPVTLTAEVYNPEQLEVTYLWEFSDNARGESIVDGISTEAAPVVYFTEAGELETVSLTVAIDGQDPMLAEAYIYITDADASALYFTDADNALFYQPLFETGSVQPEYSGMTFGSGVRTLLSAGDRLYALTDDDGVLAIDYLTLEQNALLSGVSHIALSASGTLMWAAGSEVKNAIGILFTAQQAVTGLSPYFGGFLFSTADGVFDAQGNKLMALAAENIMVDGIRQVIVYNAGGKTVVSAFDGRQLLAFDAVVPFTINDGTLYYAEGGQLLRRALGMASRPEVGQPETVCQHGAAVTAIAFRTAE